jgi:hypothetical protein
MNTKDRIHQAIVRFNDRYNNQVNLSSEAAIQELTAVIYDAVLKIGDYSTGTFNEQQMYLFKNNDKEEPK